MENIDTQEKNTYKDEFIKFALNQQVLRFGEFTLKSGRLSPYFFNAGLFNTGRSLLMLGQYYAQALKQAGISNFMLYGPAYKGIPLATAAASAYAALYDTDVAYAFNRKEKKDHGEGGIVVGSELQGDVVIVDDVITAGTSVRESFDIIEQQGATVKAVLIALDRQERLVADKKESAIQQIQQNYNIPVYSIITMADLLSYVSKDKDLKKHLEAIKSYRLTYGIDS